VESRRDRYNTYFVQGRVCGWYETMFLAGFGRGGAKLWGGCVCCGQRGGVIEIL
jgi:hypothetical protein